ncbi:CD4-1 molecule [Rhinichthys klamathensis goyatoka]|uniref:CD4-1 molecule n=1 Tax=Rhinichthys klamathensis goyatoka TaxID=3034132 RepID=UPI0024B4A143|nr:CD4-1 molecule [Rhinichthys klamathensis goyatoka]
MIKYFAHKITIHPLWLCSEDRMMFSWILISLLVRFLKAQESPIVVYAQIGGTAILPRDVSVIPNKESSFYVNWYCGLDQTNQPTISKNPQSGIQKGKDVKTHASLLSDFSLQISPVQDFDFEVWRCEQHVLTSKFTKTYKLYHVTIPKVPAVMFGDPLSLECKLDDSSVKPSVTWIPPENSDCHQNKLYKKTISIKDVSRCHSGVWTCKVKYDGREAEATTTVSVIDLSPSPPDPIYTSASPSSTVNIPCSLSSNIPWSVLNETGLRGGSWNFTPLSDQKQQSLLSLSIGPVVRWDITPDTDSKVQGRELKDQDLSFNNLPVSEKIRGEYNCYLKFYSKTLRSKVKVEVLQVSSSGGPRVYVGQRVNLTCTLGHPHAPDLEVKWKCRSCSSLHSSPFLSIPEVTMEHSGQWTCELWKNEKRLTYAVLSLKIEKAPVDIWLCVAISSGVVVFILLLVIAIIGIRRHKQIMMYRRRKTRFCCCKTPQPQGFYKT